MLSSSLKGSLELEKTRVLLPTTLKLV
jgi:hypothetical protein